MRHDFCMEKSPLPIFFLYGEPLKSADPDFVHVENLAARSKPSDWSIAPHKHADLNHIILITRGGGTIRYESDLMDFRAPRLLLVPARYVHGFDWSADSDGMVLTIADVHLLQLVERYPAFGPLFAEPRTVTIARREAADMAGVMAAMVEELSWCAVGQSAAIEAGLLMVLVRVQRQLHHFAQAHVQPVRQAGLVGRYRQLVEQRFRLREPIEVYARELAVSLTTLREACAAAGQSPTEIRDHRAMLEAQRLLAYSAATVAEIGRAVGIPDPAYFSRFFSRKCGQSPDAWRRSVVQSKRHAAGPARAERSGTPRNGRVPADRQPRRPG